MGRAVKPAALRPTSVPRLLVGAASLVYPDPGVLDFAMDFCSSGCVVLTAAVGSWVPVWPGGCVRGVAGWCCF